MVTPLWWMIGPQLRSMAVRFQPAPEKLDLLCKQCVLQNRPPYSSQVQIAFSSDLSMYSMMQLSNTFRIAAGDGRRQEISDGRETGGGRGSR